MTLTTSRIELNFGRVSISKQITNCCFKMTLINAALSILLCLAATQCGEYRGCCWNAIGLRITAIIAPFQPMRSCATDARPPSPDVASQTSIGAAWASSVSSVRRRTTSA